MENVRVECRPMEKENGKDENQVGEYKTKFQTLFSGGG